MVEITNKNIMILGEGASGKAAFNALKEIAKPYFFMPLFNSDDILIDLIVTSPGIGSHPMFDFALKNNIPIISEIELGFLLNEKPIIAITGTNGKTTVTRLIGDMLAKKYKVAVCGNIGLPFCSIVNDNHDIIVVEVSSFQLERCFLFKPHIALITNITEDHLDRHGSMQNYINIKMSISKNQDKDNYFILPSELREFLPEFKSKLIYSDKNAYINCGYIEYKGEKVVSLSSVKIEGQHNKKNIMQAIIAAKLMGVDNEDIIQAIEKFKIDKHRLELVSIVGGKRWYDDSKATNIDSCIAACDSMIGDTALILGGSDKGYDYDQLFENLPKQIKVIFLMGETVFKMRESSSLAKYDPMIVGAEDLNEAVKLAKDLSIINVLLSPAAASFDRYKDYKERGEEFRRLVNTL
ncbi:MAG: UDP-N-acetylmuramoyl-L-alanine--D-glutamate ligase [Firmicutes bacterium]|nr:UDP-N-acetylmuramoyl-L-alanine--D-glutamate ligase [Bacillota bacterium]